MFLLAALPAFWPQFSAFALSRFGLLVVVVAAVLLFYEGLPLGPLRHLPFGIGHAIESVADGRVDRQRRAGAAQEDLVWQEAERRAKAKADADLAAKQDQIDAITIARTDDASRAAALERAIAEEKAHAQTVPAACPPRGRVSRGVSVELDRAGRR